jgi:putative protease
MAQEEKKTPVGKVTHFFSKIGVAVVELTGTLRVGDEILVEGKQTSFRQKVESMQIEHQNITIAEAGKSVGLKLNDRARDGDIVFIVS